MMGFCGEGEITKVTETKNGNVIIVVKDTQIGFNTSNGQPAGMVPPHQEGLLFTNAFLFPNQSRA